MTNPTALMWDVRVDTFVVGMERRSDHRIPVLDLQFQISKRNLLFFAPDTTYETRPVSSVRQLAVPACDYLDHDLRKAYQHSFHMLSSANVVPPDVIPLAAPAIASRLRSVSRPAIFRSFANFVRVVIRLRIRLCHLYDIQEAASPAAAAALGGSTRESIVSRGLFASSSPHQVEEFLRRSRARTWDSETPCPICLECLGGEDDAEDKSMKTEAEEEIIISLPSCSHLFHGACISKWFEVSDSCPLCRTTVHVGFRSVGNL